MKKRHRWNYYLLISLQILIGIDIIYRCGNNRVNFLISFGLFLFVVLNDRLRISGFLKNERGYYLSIFISMIISMVLAYKIQGYIDIYVSIILFELILFTEGTISRLLIGVEVAFWLLLVMFRIFYIEDITDLGLWKKNLLDILMIIQGLFFYLISMFSYRALKLEKRKVDKLNKKLELSYRELKKQSEEIEELTIAKERNRVAGEIHDNLGHSLIALNMNLDVTENVIDKDPIKARKLINKSQILAKESMESLRKAVYALKEDSSRVLRESINGIIDNIEDTGKANIILNMDGELERLPAEYKNVIYSSVKESLTNSMKHGKADNVNIDIKSDGNNVNINIKDNGLGCSKLVKGSGLLNMEYRIDELHGQVLYNSRINEGFELNIFFFI